MARYTTARQLLASATQRDRMRAGKPPTVKAGPDVLAEARAILADRAARRFDRYAAPARTQPLRRGKTPIPLGGHTIPAPKGHERKQNWRPPAPATGKTDVKTYNLGRYSSRCTYQHYEYRVLVESWGRPTPGGTGLYWRIDTNDGPRSRTVKAPRGWAWGVDANGIRLYLRSDPRTDYHPDAIDFLTTEDVRSFTQTARTNAATRAANAREARREAGAVRKAEREGCRVCLADSLRAGNCRAGSETWARTHGLDPARHYKPSEVLALANGDTHRVALVCTVALKRHRLEMVRGVCDLAEHRPG